MAGSQKEMDLGSAPYGFPEEENVEAAADDDNKNFKTPPNSPIKSPSLLLKINTSEVVPVKQPRRKRKSFQTVRMDSPYKAPTSCSSSSEDEQLNDESKHTKKSVEPKPNNNPNSPGVKEEKKAEKKKRKHRKKKSPDQIKAESQALALQGFIKVVHNWDEMFPSTDMNLFMKNKSCEYFAPFTQQTNICSCDKMKEHTGNAKLAQSPNQNKEHKIGSGLKWEENSFVGDPRKASLELHKLNNAHKAAGLPNWAGSGYTDSLLPQGENTTSFVPTTVNNPFLPVYGGVNMKTQEI